MTLVAHLVVAHLVVAHLCEGLNPLHAQAVHQKLQGGRSALQPERSPVTPSEPPEYYVRLVQIPAPYPLPQKLPALEPAAIAAKPRSQLSRNRAIPRTASLNRRLAHSNRG